MGSQDIGFWRESLPRILDKATVIPSLSNFTSANFLRSASPFSSIPLFLTLADMFWKEALAMS